MGTEHYWNILTPKLWPSALCLFRSPWLLNRTLFCVLAFPTTPCLLPSSTVLLALLLTYLPLSSIRRPYITFKLPRCNIDTPQRLRNLFRFPATGCVTSFRCTTSNGIFGKVKRSKHNSTILVFELTVASRQRMTVKKECGSQWRPDVGTWWPHSGRLTREGRR